jgi:hypothetical protein
MSKDQRLLNNLGSWARNNGLLLIDQPLRTGYSQPALNDSIPTDEAFFLAHSELSERPLHNWGELWREICTLNCTLLLQARDMMESRRGNPTALTSLRLPVPRIRTVVSGCSFLPGSHLPSLGKAF